ncbi:hypothetical protein [Desulfocurvus sp. DL9XJH121]
MMRGEAWERGTAGRAGVFDMGAVALLVQEAACGELGVAFAAFAPTRPPRIPRGTLVRVNMSGPVVREHDGSQANAKQARVRAAGEAGATLTRTKTEPWHDGRQWFVDVVGMAGPVPCTGLEVVG